MCGLIGFSGSQNANMHKVLHLLADNDSRGGHSSGLYINDKLLKCLKVSANLMPLLAKNDMKDFGKLIVGHTRYATHGSHTVENAHPFQYKNIIGAHNGVINNYEEVGNKFNLKKTVVDSQMVFKVLAENDKKHQRIGMFDGKVNLIFTKGDGKLYVFKHGNPLYALKTKEGTYLSSLEEGLKNIKEEGDNLYDLKPDILYVYENGRKVYQEAIKRNEVAINTYTGTYGYHNYGYGGYLGEKYGTGIKSINSLSSCDSYNTIGQYNMLSGEVDDMIVEEYEIMEHLNETEDLLAECSSRKYSESWPNNDIWTNLEDNLRTTLKLIRDYIV